MKQSYAAVQDHFLSLHSDNRPTSAVSAFIPTLFAPVISNELSYSWKQYGRMAEGLALPIAHYEVSVSNSDGAGASISYKSEYAPSEDSNQTAFPRKLIRILVVRL